jgi:hypothetical protein
MNLKPTIRKMAQDFCRYYAKTHEAIDLYHWRFLSSLLEVKYYEEKEL